MVLPVAAPYKCRGRGPLLLSPLLILMASDEGAIEIHLARIWLVLGLRKFPDIALVFYFPVRSGRLRLI